jgi:hypothetical protein
MMLLVGSMTWGGCAGVGQGRPVLPAYQDPIVKGLVEKYSKPEAIPTNQSAVTSVQRNQILNELLYLTDVNYFNFQSQLYRGRALFETATDLAIIGLGAAGALVGSSVTQALLAAISGGIAGGRVSINKNYFQEASTQALIAKMDAARKAKLDLMRKAMTLDVSDYPLAQGLTDLAEYYNSGTIIGALQGIVADAGAQTKAAEASLERTLSGKYSRDSAGDILRNFWKPDGKTINADNAAALKKWIEAWSKTQDMGEMSITFFLGNDAFKDARAQAVKDLNLSK